MREHTDPALDPVLEVVDVDDSTDIYKQCIVEKSVTIDEMKEWGFSPNTSQWSSEMQWKIFILSI
ncbi:MAG: hypothetical protein ACYSOC_04015 [Planctomycetota bacterium]